jgi:hypothetical protein
MRFDPVWRRIKPDTFTTKLEGQFRERLDRLDGLNNWGSLAWLYDHATASKQAHHFGLEWNAMRFLDGDATRAKYRPSFRTAAHVAHWGHLPVSYAGEEALLRAGHVEANVQSVVEGIIDEVIAFGALRCDKDGHDCATAIRSADRPFLLYRWLSAWLVKRDWNRVWKAIKSACETVPDEAETKAALIQTLVCGDSRGFKILGRCNQADYVPRDLLQAGTAWLTFDIEALWEGNPLGSDAAREWSLVDSAQSYLDDRFFHSPEALLVHSLVARAIAGGLLAEGVTKGAIVDLTAARDEHFITKLKPYHRDRLAQVRSRVPRISERWAHVGSWSDVSLDEGSRLAMEDQLSGATGRSRVSYPFTTGVSVIVEPGSTSFPAGLDYAGQGRRFATVHVHHESPAGVEVAARPMLNVVAKIGGRLIPGHDLGNNIVGWLLGTGVEQRATPVERMCGEIAASKADEFRSAIAELLALKSAEDVLKHRVINGLLSALADPGFPMEGRSGLAALLLRLPWVCLRYSPGRAILELFKDEALNRAAAGDGATRGYALEVAVAADQLLEESGPRHRFLFMGATRIGKDGQPAQEWDTLRLDLDGSQSWSLTAIESAVSRSTSKDDESRARLEFLRGHVAGRFSDLATYRTLFATIKSGRLRYEDAGRSWTKV